MTNLTRFKSPPLSKDISTDKIPVKLQYFAKFAVIIVAVLNILTFTAVRSEDINTDNATNTTHSIDTTVRNTFKFQLLSSEKHKTENENVGGINNETTAPAPYCPSEPTIQVLNMYAGRNYTRRSNDEDGKVLFYTIAQDPEGKTVIIESNGQIFMSCTARQPVMWSFQGVLSQDVIKSIETNRESLDPQNPETFCYTTNITVPFPRPPKFPTFGQYACVNPTTNMDGGDLMATNITSVFLFANDNLPDLFLKPNGNTLISKSFSSDTSVIVPCRGNNPNFTAVLTKQDKNGSYTPLNSDLYDQVYNPKYGFTITPKASNISQNTSLSPPLDFKSDLYGNYKCKSVVKPKYGRPSNPVEVNVLVISAGKTPQKSSQLKIASQNYVNGSCKRFICIADSEYAKNGGNTSSNLNLTLEMTAFECSSPTNCKLSLGFLQDGSDNPSNLQYLQILDNTAEIDTCGRVQYNSSTDEEINKMVASLDISTKYEGGGVVICRTSDKKQYQHVQFFKSLTSAVVLNSADNADTTSNIDGASFIHITGPNRTIYVKENVQINCNFSSFLFTEGYRLLVQYSNGSLSSPQIISYNENFLAEQLIFELKAAVNATSESMVSLVCLAPLWNSEKWVNLTYPVTVSEGTVPEFLDVSDSSVSYYDTDEDVTLVCEAGGSPAPVVTWYNNGEPYMDSTGNAWTETIQFENSTRSLLHFKNVTHHVMTIQGIYTCNATNVRGTITFPITVQVDMFQTWLYWALPLSILFLILMIILSVYLCKFWKKSQVQERYINQLTKYEIQQFKYGRRSVKTPGRDDSVKDISSGLPNYANISGGIEEALDLPYDEAKFEIPEQDLIFEEIPVRLGEGNFGIVLQGTLLQNYTRLPVAVKTLKQWNVNEAKILLSELKILMFVGKHENVVSLLGAVTNIAEYKIQVVIEYCAEGSLEKFLRDKRDLFLDEVKDGRIQFTQVPFDDKNITNYVKTDFALRTFDLIRWAHQFARGMEYLSALKIIHGDLAARNLLLTDTRELKITDFGLSKKLKNYQTNYIPSDSSSEREQPWRSLAVECWVDNKKLSTESDVWAYGITLWEIFSLAKVPYPDFPMYTPDFIRHLLQGYRMSSPQYATKHIFQIMMDCWESAPENRPTFSMLVMTFEKFLPQNYVQSLHYFVNRNEQSPISIITEAAQNIQNNENNVYPPQTLPEPEPQPSRPKNIAHNVSYIYADDMEQLEMEHL